MIYGLSFLFILYALVIGIPAIRHLFRIRAINRNCASTAGEVLTNRGALGWLWTSTFGHVSRPLIRYHSPKGDELIYEVTTSNLYTKFRFQPGAIVEMVFDKDRPTRSYAKPEWQTLTRELWITISALFLAVTLWIIGIIFKLPF